MVWWMVNTKLVDLAWNDPPNCSKYFYRICDLTTVNVKTLLYELPRKLEYVKDKLLHFNSIGLHWRHDNSLVIAEWNFLLGDVMLQFMLSLTKTTRATYVCRMKTTEANFATMNILAKY